MQIRLSGIVNDSIVDGTGIRLTVFTQGCTHNCKGCHNPQTHDLLGGYLTDTDEILGRSDFFGRRAFFAAAASCRPCGKGT